MYINEPDEDFKQELRSILFNRYLEDAGFDQEEALAMMYWRLHKAEDEECYEECAIIKDILIDFEYIP